MKNLKKLLFLVLSIGILAGCSNVSTKESSEVKDLKADLGVKVVEYTKKYFNLDMNLKDFDTSLGEKVGDNQFEDIETIDTKNPIYFTGLNKGNPEDIIRFVLVYNSKNEEILELGVQTVNDEELVYADIE